MPITGERSLHNCPDCGQPMFWAECAVQSRHLPTKTGRDIIDTIEYVNAYRCVNGHTSQRCPLCGSYATVAWRDRENFHYHVICGSCGNDSVVNVPRQ